MVSSVQCLQLKPPVIKLRDRKGLPTINHYQHYHYDDTNLYFHPLSVQFSPTFLSRSLNTGRPLMPGNRLLQPIPLSCVDVVVRHECGNREMSDKHTITAVYIQLYKYKYTTEMVRQKAEWNEIDRGVLTMEQQAHSSHRPTRISKNVLLIFCIKMFDYCMFIRRA